MAHRTEGVTHHREAVNGIRIHWVSAGSGDPLVLVHGFPQTSFAWRKVVPVLSQHFSVIAPDLRGCGDTDRPDGVWDKRTAASDIHALLSHLDAGPVHLVGHDVGMMVVFAFAHEYPADTRSLCLLEAALPGLGLEDYYNADKYPGMYHLPLFDAPNGLAESLIEGRERLFVEHFMRQQSYDPTGPDDAALEEYARRLAAPGALRGGMAYFRSHRVDAVHNRRYAKTLLPMPVLALSGSASLGHELAPQIRPLAHELKSVVLPRCGHYLAEERPELLTAELLDFLCPA